MKTKADYHKHSYTTILCLTAYGMANLNVLMSIGTILLVVLWFMYPGPKKGWNNFINNKPAVAMAGLYLMHVVWLFNTEDYAYAMKDLRIKLPLLALAVAVGGASISSRQVKYAFIALAAGTLVASVKAYTNYMSMDEQLFEFRNIVHGISHIRLSLMMVLVVAAIFYFWKSMSTVFKVLGAITVINTLYFFDLLQSSSGLLILLALVVFSMFYMARKHSGTKGVLWIASVVALFVLASGISLNQYYQHYFTSDQDLTQLPEYTAMGNRYEHHNDARQIENGNYIFILLAEDEMLDAWSERSSLEMRGEEHVMRRARLVRYLTSLGLPKDREGVMALSENDIKNVEGGYPSVVYTQKRGLALRLHTTVFGFHQYIVTQNASGSSFFQRLVYWQAAVELIKDHFWLGTGTGDVKAAFQQIYEEMDVSLLPQFQLRAHNQYLTFWVSFGILGFLFFLLLFVIPFYEGPLPYLAVAFILIAFLSCLTEDTLETQAGVTFFAFFYALSTHFVHQRKGYSPQAK